MTSVAATHFGTIVISLSGLVVVDGAIAPTFQTVGTNVIVARYLPRLVVVNGTVTPALQTVRSNIIVSRY
jgi:hypothetical protein